MNRLLRNLIALPIGLAAFFWTSCFATAEKVSDFSGASYSPYSIRYQNNNLKGFGEYNIGDITGDLSFMKSQGVTMIKTYNAGLTGPQPFSQLESYVTNFNVINANPSGAGSAIQNLNDPFTVGGITGTKWVLGQAAAQEIKIYQGTNVSGDMLGTLPSGTQSNLSVTLRTSGTTRTVGVTPGSYTYTDFSGSSQTIAYSMAHWDVELALMNIANGRMNIQQPAVANGAYTVTELSGSNTDYTKGLIIGNEVLSNNLTSAQVAQVMAFAKARRTDYGLTAAEVPITSSTNSPGNWEGSMATDVLPYVDGMVFYNDYGFPFDGAGEAEGGQTVTPKNGIQHVLDTHETFVQWLQANGHGDVEAIIGEHGWPTTSLDNTANSFSIANAKLYYMGDGSGGDPYKGSLKSLADVGTTNFLFEFFDEPWKNGGSPGSSENHFGVATAVQDLQRLNPATDPSQYPEIRTMKFTGGEFSDLLGLDAVPEPGSASLLIAGLLALAGSARKRRCG